MKRLAIVSSYNESCGIAAFTRVLKHSIPDVTDVEVEVITLNLRLLKSSIKEYRKLADEHIREICQQLKNFDAVNIQLEPGLYGTIPSDIINRVKNLVNSNSITSVTLHSPLLIGQKNHIFRLAVKNILHFNLKAGFKMLLSCFSGNIILSINKKILRHLIRVKCRLIVHTTRTKNDIETLYGYTNVDIHPLQIVLNNVKFNDNIISTLKKSLKIEDDSIIIGMFGYLSNYKGHLEALDALKHLPSKYKLMIFGRQHPQTIIYNQKDAYLNSLVLKISKSHELKNRVFFLGELDEDQDFINAVSAADVVWLPYYENGQDGSGIASICFSVAKRILASSSFAFDELLKLTPYNNIFRFDIGNFLEMALKTKIAMDDNVELIKPRFWENYNIETQAKIYVKDIHSD